MAVLRELQGIDTNKEQIAVKRNIPSLQILFVLLAIVSLEDDCELNKLDLIYDTPNLEKKFNRAHLRTAGVLGEEVQKA